MQHKSLLRVIEYLSIPRNNDKVKIRRKKAGWKDEEELKSIT